MAQRLRQRGIPCGEGDGRRIHGSVPIRSAALSPIIMAAAWDVPADMAGHDGCIGDEQSRNAANLERGIGLTMTRCRIPSGRCRQGDRLVPRRCGSGARHLRHRGRAVDPFHDIVAEGRGIDDPAAQLDPAPQRRHPLAHRAAPGKDQRRGGGSPLARSIRPRLCGWLTLATTLTIGKVPARPRRGRTG